MERATVAEPSGNAIRMVPMLFTPRLNRMENVPSRVNVKVMNPKLSSLSLSERMMLEMCPAKTLSAPRLETRRPKTERSG